MTTSYRYSSVSFKRSVTLLIYIFNFVYLCLSWLKRLKWLKQRCSYPNAVCVGMQPSNKCHFTTIKTISILRQVEKYFRLKIIFQNCNSNVIISYTHTSLVRNESLHAKRPYIVDVISIDFVAKGPEYSSIWIWCLISSIGVVFESNKGMYTGKLEGLYDHSTISIHVSKTFHFSISWIYCFVIR